jgi:hypothetical protein
MTAMECASHPGTETFLRCGKCERPICVRCTVHTPVGARCRSCASNKASPLFQASPGQYALSVPAALVTSLFLGWLPMMLLFLGPVIYGYAVGEATLRAGGRRRGLGMQIVSGAAAFVGILFWRLGGPAGVAHGAALSPSHFLAIASDPFTLLAVALGAGFAAVRVRDI